MRLVLLLGGWRRNVLFPFLSLLSFGVFGSFFSGSLLLWSSLLPLLGFQLRPCLFCVLGSLCFSLSGSFCSGLLLLSGWLSLLGLLLRTCLLRLLGFLGLQRCSFLSVSLRSCWSLIECARTALRFLDELICRTWLARRRLLWGRRESLSAEEGLFLLLKLSFFGFDPLTFCRESAIVQRRARLRGLLARLPGF